MKTKLKLIVLLILIITFVSTFQTTFSRYASAATGNVTTNIAKWQISLNNNDITNGSSNSINISPEFVSNPNVANNKIAPGSSGYFDILINPANVDVSFEYSIILSTPSEVSDIKITKYATSSGNTFNSTGATEHIFTDNEARSIVGRMLYNNATTNFSFSTFVIRVFFVWDDDNTNDLTDTQVGLKAARNETIQSNITATINFNQYIG